MNEDRFAYKFTDKETGEERFGLLLKSGDGVDTFRTILVLDVDVSNPDGTGIVSETEKYTIEKVENYKGTLPTWLAE